MACCDIFNVFDEKELLVKEYKHWKLLVSNRPKTLGSCVVITKTHHERLSELSAEEMAELASVAKDVERGLKATWQFDKINWLMLMMKDKHTHFHVHPRYAQEREFDGIVWKADVAEWDPLRLPTLPASTETLIAIRDKLRTTTLK